MKPVINLAAGHTAVDAYEIPSSLREQILLRNPADVFPYAAAVSRSIDIDHTIPYLSPDKGGPPRQTRIGNLGPHTRYHHRIKTTAASRSDNQNPAPGSGDHPTAASTQSTPPAPIPLATPNSPRRSGVPPSRTPVPHSLWSWVNHPPRSCRLLRVRCSQRDDEIGSWQALRDEHRIVLVSRTGPIVSLVVAHSVLLVAVGQPLQTRRVIHL
jgi:hypothetical protein